MDPAAARCLSFADGPPVWPRDPERRDPERRDPERSVEGLDPVDAFDPYRTDGKPGRSVCALSPGSGDKTGRATHAGFAGWAAEDPPNLPKGSLGQG